MAGLDLALNRLELLDDLLRLHSLPCLAQSAAVQNLIGFPRKRAVCLRAELVGTD